MSKRSFRPKLPMVFPIWRPASNDTLNICDTCRRGLWVKDDGKKHFHSGACNRSIRSEVTPEELEIAIRTLETIV